MANLQAQFKEFNQKIYITDQSNGYKKAKEKDDSICNQIKEDFASEGYPVIESRMQGSFAVNTAIHSLDGDYDFDRMIIIDSHNAPDDPVVPKRVVKEVLEKRNFKDPKIKLPCITADYKSVNLHIDYTVYKKDSNDTYYLAVGKHGSGDEHKEWSQSDQKGLIDWINNKKSYVESEDKKLHQFKRLVRFMKRWKDFSFNPEVKKKIFSIGLTVMIKEQYNCLYGYRETVDDIEAMKAIVDNILDSSYLIYQGDSKYRVSVKLPTVPYRNIFQHKVNGYFNEGSDLNIGTQFRNKLLTLQNNLQKVIDELDPHKASIILREDVFGTDFPLVQENENIAKNKRPPYSKTGQSA